MAAESALAPYPDWIASQMPFARRHVATSGGRIHLIDHGQGPAVVLVHGNPMWSFLWRKVIPYLVDANLRCIAPDLLGFGLSDKPRSPDDHQLEHHARILAEVIDALDLQEVVVVGQDWGGPIGLGAARLSKAKVRGICLGNTAVLAPARPFRPKPFHRLSQISGLSDALFLGGGFPLSVVDRVQGDRSSIGRAQKRAYRWPFSKMADRAGPLGLARMVPTDEAHPSTAFLDDMEPWLAKLGCPVALVWGRRDPILGAALNRHRRFFPEARVIETQAGHFLQEEVPDLFAEAIIGVAAGREQRDAAS